MTEKHPAVTFALFLVLTTGLTMGLQQLDSGLRIDWSDPIGWFETASVENAAGATVRLIGLTLGYWVVVSTTLYAIANRVRHRPRLVTWATLPFARRLADRALATALAGSIVLSPMSPALGEQPPPPPVVFDITSDGVPIPHVQYSTPIDEATPTIANEPASPQVPTAPVAEAPKPTPAIRAIATEPSPTATKYTVVAGDSLWAIALREVGQGADGDAAAVTSYWRQVMAANRTTLRSGDPNLIYPGEIVTLPEVQP
ncbi:MAG: LysM peptidoglycan-binding domain-containing protein [bacterium]|nr:LysM peptidoglycan-binding domain-containing protein [bacterium]MCP4964214.1 LysM peptidoglycan-binding domain-containing protein [bacterium]